MKLKRSDRDAVIVLLIIIVISIVVFPYIDDIIKGDDEKQSLISTLLKEKRYAEKRRNGEYSHGSKNKNSQNEYYAVNEKKHELFSFDPNTADSTAFLRLGLRPWQVRNIYKYRAAGGKYRQPSDFANLYGLTAAEYERLLPYIKIKPERMAAEIYGTKENVQESNTSNTQDVKPEQIKPDTIMFPKKIKQGEQININIADTTLLKRIPGIGSYFAMRIVKKREQLGGYYSVNQLREIENFPLSSLPFMNVGKKNASNGHVEGIQLIRINNLNARELSRHPYIKYVQAKQIDEYRRMSGNFKNADELNKLPSFSPDDVTRLAPYLRFD